MSTPPALRTTSQRQAREGLPYARGGKGETEIEVPPAGAGGGGKEMKNNAKKPQEQHSIGERV